MTHISTHEHSAAPGHANRPREIRGSGGIRVLRPLDALPADTGPVRGELLITPLEDGSLPFRASLAVLWDAAMELSVNRPVPPGSLLKLQCADTVWLGESCQCVRHPERGVYSIWVRLEHAIYGPVNSRYAPQNRNNQCLAL